MEERLIEEFKEMKGNPNSQLKKWIELSDEDVEKIENSGVFEDILENMFGEYINGVDKKAVVKALNSSRQHMYYILEKGKYKYRMLAYEGLLQNIYETEIFNNAKLKNIFSFEQFFEILSNSETIRELKNIMAEENAEDILKSIAEDSQSWGDKLQYLIDLDFTKRKDIIQKYAFNQGRDIIDEEKQRRQELFHNMEQTTSVSAENMLQAIFGITYDEAKELIKKYGIEIENLDIIDEDEKKTKRKLEIIKRITELENLEDNEQLKKYYNEDKDEFFNISQEDVSVFYKVDLEKSFIDLYARQYDRELKVETTPLEDMEYDGKKIKVCKANGDFTFLIRGEQNVSKEEKQNFWNSVQPTKGLCQCTISQDYIRTVFDDKEDWYKQVCFVASTSCKDGELRMASTTNIKSGRANNNLSNLGINSDWGNGIIFRTPREQINNSRGTNNETVTTRNVYNSKTGYYERKPADYVVYIQETDDAEARVADKHFETAQFVASQTGWPILIITREEYAKSEQEKIEVLKRKLLEEAERSENETDENIIRELIVKFNNNREGILTSKTLSEKYFTEGEHIELVGLINQRLSDVKKNNPKEYDGLVQNIREIYTSEIEKYYAFSYDRDDAKLDIDNTREHLKPYEDFILAHERNMFDLSEIEKKKIFSVMEEISKTEYYNMNQYHNLDHIQKVIMFSGLLAKNEGLSEEETQILLAAAAFHDSGRNGSEGANDNHAVASAKQVKEYFEENKKNPFGITEENLPKIQAAIEYHEHKEKEKGITDRKKIRELCEQYKIDIKEFEFVVKISELLKDADALDRARFGKKNENRESLDARFLKSSTAKSVSMLRFSEGCNFRFSDEKKSAENSNDAKETKHEEKPEVLPIDKVRHIFDEKLEEFNKAKIQMSSIKQVTSGITASQKQTFMDVLNNIRLAIKKIFGEFNR